MLPLAATPRPTPPPRRRLALHELVRELAGWTPPPRPATTSRPPAAACSCWESCWPH